MIPGSWWASPHDTLVQKQRPPNSFGSCRGRTFISAFQVFLRYSSVYAWPPRWTCGGSPMWPYLLNMRMKAQTRRVCWPALRDFIKNAKKKARCRSRSARCLSLSLSATWMFENLLLFIAHFLKCTLIAHFISSLVMKVTPPPSSMPMSGTRPVEARLTCWLRVSECVFFLNQEFSVWIAVAMKRGEWTLKKQTNRYIYKQMYCFLSYIWVVLATRVSERMHENQWHKPK